MPRRLDIHPADLKPHLPHIVLIDIVGGGEDFRYRLIGRRLHDYFSGNPTGRLMSEALASFGTETVERTIAAHREAMARRAPVRMRGSGKFYSQGLKLFDALLTPLGDEEGHVNMIFGTFMFLWEKDKHLSTSSTGPGESELKDALA